MSDAFKHIRQNWNQSRVYRFLLAAAALYALFRLAVQGVYLLGLLPGQDGAAFVPVDLQIYLDAARHLLLKQDLYVTGSIKYMELYYYAPSFALAFVPFTWFAPRIVAVVHTLVIIFAYGLLYVWWDRIFTRFGLEKVREILALTLPAWLVFSSFWDDLGFLNVYVIMTLLFTLLLDAILEERLGKSLLWLSIILQIKPHWAFVVIIPLLFKRYRFFFKTIGLAILVYVAIAGATSFIIGFTYGQQQYLDYYQFLLNLRNQFPWRGPETPFMGYNHSITHIFIYWFGIAPNVLQLATGVKILLLIPLTVVSLRQFWQPAKVIVSKNARLVLDFAFVFYLGAFIWLDVVWELTLGIVIFPYLLATVKRAWIRFLIWVVFLPYVLLDVWRITSVAIFGSDVILPGLYIITDPSIYVPLLMIVNLIFYTLLIIRLWDVVGGQTQHIKIDI